MIRCIHHVISRMLTPSDVGLICIRLGLHKCRLIAKGQYLVVVPFESRCKVIFIVDTEISFYVPRRFIAFYEV
jgi:hypothetical protein